MVSTDVETLRNEYKRLSLQLSKAQEKVKSSIGEVSSRKSSDASTNHILKILESDKSIDTLPKDICQLLAPSLQLNNEQLKIIKKASSKANVREKLLQKHMSNAQMNAVQRSSTPKLGLYQNHKARARTQFLDEVPFNVSSTKLFDKQFKTSNKLDVNSNICDNFGDILNNSNNLRNQSKSLTSNKNVIDARPEASRVLLQYANEEPSIDSSIQSVRISYPSNDQLLGYDWIAGCLDNVNNKIERSDAFFEQLKQFRQENASECIDDSTPDGDPNPIDYPHLPCRKPDCFTGRDHTCVHLYRMNNRGFAEALSEGAQCPVCHYRRDPANENDLFPAHVRITMPVVRDEPETKPPKIKAQIKSGDSVSLTGHCKQGWESAQPSIVPPVESFGISAHLS